MNKLADLFLLLYAKKLELDDEPYQINRSSKSFIFSQQNTHFVDRNRDEALDRIYDLLQHRIITAAEYDDLYFALSLSMSPGKLLEQVSNVD